MKSKKENGQKIADLKGKLEIIYLSIADLVKLPGNPRKDKDPKAVERLAKLILKHGFRNPLDVFPENGKHTIIVGNHRFDAGLSLGMTEFPCLVYTGDKKTAFARAISDNKSNEWTEWDMPILKELFIELDSGDFDIHLTGFNSHELELMMTAEFQGEPQTDKASRQCLWQRNHPDKAKSQALCKANPGKVIVLYECSCEPDKKKHNHHFDYSRAFEVIRLCERCHVSEHNRLHEFEGEEIP